MGLAVTKVRTELMNKMESFIVERERERLFVIELWRYCSGDMRIVRDVRIVRRIDGAL